MRLLDSPSKQAMSIFLVNAIGQDFLEGTVFEADHRFAREEQEFASDAMIAIDIARISCLYLLVFELTNYSLLMTSD